MEYSKSKAVETYSKDGKYYRALDGTSVLTYEGAKLKAEAEKGNPRFIEGAESLKWKTISSPIHYPPMIDKIALERHESLKSRHIPPRYWLK
jgi:hypothetical protein